MRRSAAAGLLALLAAAPAGADGATVERRLALMGTEAAVQVEAADRASALAASEAAVQALEAAERRLSTWTDTSELARLNRAPAGAPIALSSELASELAAAERCRRETGGSFAAEVGPLVDAWGLRTGGTEPSPEALRAALAASGGEVLALGADGTAVRRRADARIEEGGFGKGAALDAARAALAAHAAVRSARLELGGQVLFVGAAAELAVADPRARGRQVLALSPSALAGRSVATSGNSERGIVVDGRRLSHILDPRTGRPALDVGSVTVVAPTGVEADCLSTGLFVMAAREGADAVLAWTAARRGVDVLLVRPLAEGGLEVVGSAGLAGAVEALDPTAVATMRIGTESPAGAAGWEEPAEVSRGTDDGAGVAVASEADRASPRSYRDREPPRGRAAASRLQRSIHARS